MKYKPTIGMEVHVELKTDSKMFCACKNELGLDRIPNSNICPVCTGQPGALPVANEKAIEYVVKAGLALDCKIAKVSKFDRKNYFYPDLPKGYQISQYDQPLCGGGKLEAGSGKEIGITRIHLEEDTGKLLHQKGTDHSLVDFNRSGVPLMELVTEPDISSAGEAKKFCEELQLILRYLEISDADMEKGHMRCEANISISKNIKEKGVKVEVKNLNSFKAVEKAIDFEIKRQRELLEGGKEVVQETRGWDESKMATFSQREKESAHDYRYFPEPDLPSLEFNESYIEKIRAELPELPAQKVERFRREYKIPRYDAEVLARDKDLACFFEESLSEAMELCSSLTKSEKITEKKSRKTDLVRDKSDGKIAKLTANYIISELKKYLNDKTGVKDLKITPENFGELVSIVAQSKINSSAAQIVLSEMVKTGADPEHIIAEKNLEQIKDESEIEKIVEKVISENPKSVADYKAGKQAVLQFLLGQVMKESKGKVDPRKATELIKRII
jgi:aspartyl-tRNA(Asn)/glutamyl-tRNA(Gln) amidotransferase subunit B